MVNLNRREEVRRLLQRRRAEGLTYRELSRQSGVPAGTLAWWSSRLRHEGRARSEAFVELSAAVPVEREEARHEAEGAALEVLLGGGRRLLVRPGFDEAELMRPWTEAFTGRCQAHLPGEQAGLQRSRAHGCCPRQAPQELGTFLPPPMRDAHRSTSATP